MHFAKNKQKPAFTLVELLVAIVVISILAAVTVVAFNGVKDRVGASVLKSDLNQAHTSLTIEKTTNGNFPNDSSAIPKSKDTKYQFTSDGSTYCLTATSKNTSKTMRIDQSGGVKEGACTGHYASVIATGGSVSEYVQDGVTYKVHTFRTSGEFTLYSDIPVDYLVVAGGGGGGGQRISGYGGSGGGAGGVLQGSINLTTGKFDIVVGSGGAKESNGEDSRLSNFAVALGGGGGAGPESTTPKSGGSGGGGIPLYGPASGTPGQGHPGGLASTQAGGGGGGAGQAGGNGGPDARDAGDGGAGLASDITGATMYYGGGGGASNGNGGTGGKVSNGGIGGGGDGMSGSKPGGNGTPNSGGGGGATRAGVAGSGGSGIVIIRYALPF